MKNNSWNELDFSFGTDYDAFEKWFECLLSQCMNEVEEEILYKTKTTLFENWLDTVY